MIDQALLTELQYALLEPVKDGGQTWASQVWSRDEVVEAVNAGERQLLRDTQLLITRVEIPVLANATQVDLPADWIASVHLVWRDTASGDRMPLGPADAFAADFGLPTWQASPGTPIVFLDLDSITLTFRLAPTPFQDGVVELLYVAQPTPINGNGRSFTVSDDYLDAVKYGALGHLLSKVGRLQDPERAAYCEERGELVRLLSDIILKGWS
jgi:hypothetical protein